MNDSSNTTAEFDQADEDILSRDVSDEALEAAAGPEGPKWMTIVATYLGRCC
jgi:hypothetical protein